VVKPVKGGGKGTTLTSNPYGQQSVPTLKN
jgi:hypothetical protein